ncbi:MAG: hypothetical protein ACE5G3_07955, partial [Gammaproteobacteria bacterium]
MSVHALLAEAMRTRRRFGIGLSRQAWQATRLRWSRNRLDPWEYYFFRVFLHRYPMAEKRRFIGWRREMDLDRLLNSGAERDLARRAADRCGRGHEVTVLCLESRNPAGDVPGLVVLHGDHRVGH